jgi:hypothetical protein
MRIIFFRRISFERDLIRREVDELKENAEQSLDEDIQGSDTHNACCTAGL